MMEMLYCPMANKAVPGNYAPKKLVFRCTRCGSENHLKVREASRLSAVLEPSKAKKKHFKKGGKAKGKKKEKGGGAGTPKGGKA